MESLKVLAARTVAARVSSEESLNNLEVPKSLLGDLLVAYQDHWSRRKVIGKRSSIPFYSRKKNESAKKNTRMVNLKYDDRTKKVHRTIFKNNFLVTIPWENQTGPTNPFVWAKWPPARL